MSKYHKSTNSSSTIEQRATAEQTGASGARQPEQKLGLLMNSCATRQGPSNSVFRTLSLRGIDERVENLLWNMSVYLEWWLEERVATPWLFSTAHGSWHWHMLRGFTMLSLSDTEKACKAFSKASVVADKMISQGHHDLL